MGITNWLGNKLIDVAQQKNAEIGGRYVLSHQSGKPYIKPTKLKQFVNRYASWVYACANRNAINSAQVPLNLFVAKPTGAKNNSRFRTIKPNKETVGYLKSSPSTRQYVVRAAEIEQLLEHPFIDLIQNVNEFMNGFELFETTFLFLELTGNAYWYIGPNDTDSTAPYGRPFIKGQPGDDDCMVESAPYNNGTDYEHIGKSFVCTVD